MLGCLEGNGEVTASKGSIIKVGNGCYYIGWKVTEDIKREAGGDHFLPTRSFFFINLNFFFAKSGHFLTNLDNFLTNAGHF